MQTNETTNSQNIQPSSAVIQVWTSVLGLLKSEITDTSFRTWFEPVEPVALTHDTLKLSVQDGIYKNMIMTKYYSLIEDSLTNVTGKSYRIEVVCADDDVSAAVTAPTTALGKTFNPKYTFENFVIGTNNNIAHAASVAVSENLGSFNNPLFLYGGSGLGKTHLLHAIANHAQSLNPNLKIMYVTTEEFVNDYVNSMLSRHTNKKAVQDFKDKYRTIDLFLVDDIQFVGGKDSSQDEFFHTFNALYENNKQIVLTSDRLPAEIPELEERLRTRFDMGLRVDVQPPDFEMRVAILKSKIQNEYFTIEDDVLEYVAENIRSNVRDLEGAVKRMLAYASIQGQRTNRITEELAEKALKDIFTVQKKKLTTASIISEVEKYFANLPKGSLVSKNRSKSVTFPRHIAMYLCRTVADMSLPDIGRDFGGRNHTTVIHAVDKISEDMRNSPEVEKAVSDLIENITKN